MDSDGGIYTPSLHHAYCSCGGRCEVKGRPTVSYDHGGTPGPTDGNDAAEWEVWMRCGKCGTVQRLPASGDIPAV